MAQLVEKLPAMPEDLGLIPGLGRSPGEGKGRPFQYTGLENLIVHGVEKSWESERLAFALAKQLELTHIAHLLYFTKNNTLKKK